MNWDGIRAFCLFIGYGRSGHSAIGGVLDAHPNAVVSHELHAIKHYLQGVPRDALFDAIYERAHAQARTGRPGSRAGGGTYSHGVEGQLKASAEGVTVIGDKKGAGTAWQIARHGLGRLDDFKQYVGVPVKILHVMRNPYDMIAACRNSRGESRVAALARIADAARARYGGSDWLDVYLEDVIERPGEQIARILEFLELPVLDEHRRHCEAYLFSSPHRRRFEVAWTGDQRKEVEDVIQRHEFLRRYGWDD